MKPPSLAVAAADGLPADVCAQARSALRQGLSRIAAASGLSLSQTAALLDDLSAELRTQALTQKALPPLPARAPELWTERDRRPKETSADFTRRVYGRWLGRELTRLHLKSFDFPLYRALAVWITRNPVDDIAVLFPNRTREINEMIEDLTTRYAAADLRKLGFAIAARLRRRGRIIA